MVNRSGVAPAVESILRATQRRETPSQTVSVDPRPIDRAIQHTREEGRTPVIAEIKPTSPTTAGEHEQDPVELAASMVEGGATALSVLTEPSQFGGTPEMLRRVRSAVDVPVLRKDFILQPAQLDRVRADIVLVIARFVERLDELVAEAKRRGFQVLVETHTRSEIERATATGADLIGINNRDLAELSVDLERVKRLGPAVPDSTTLVAESGITTGEDVRRMQEAGADAMLIGSAIMNGDTQANTRRLVEAKKRQTQQ